MASDEAEFAINRLNVQFAIKGMIIALTADTEDPAVIAYRLETAGFAGRIDSGTECPLAKYVWQGLVKLGLLGPDERVVMEYVGEDSGGSHLETYVESYPRKTPAEGRLRLPDVLLQFGLAFDARQFPSLVVE